MRTKDVATLAEFMMEIQGLCEGNPVTAAAVALVVGETTYTYQFNMDTAGLEIVARLFKEYARTKVTSH